MGAEEAKIEEAMGSDRFGVSGAEEFERLREELRVARRAFAERSDDPAARDAFWIAEKTMRLFRFEHDAAGAFKFKKFGRETAALLSEGISRESVADRRMLFVNMGELDRFNKEGGGHEAGDAALRETVKAVEAAARAAGSACQVFRYSGNEYLVSFEDISEAKLSDVQLAIEAARPSVPGVREGAPLTAVRVDMQEAFDIVEAERRELGDAFEEGNPPREFIGAIRRLADWALENKKFVARAERVASKLGDPDVDAFFANYMAKMFADTELHDVDAFRFLYASAGPEGFRAAVERMAFEAAKKRLVGERAFANIVEDIVATRVEARRAEMREPNAIEPGDLSVSSPGVPLARLPARTLGHAAIDRAEAAYAAAAAEGSGRGAELAKLDLEIERARRDGGTGLLERGVYYESLESRLLAGEGDVSVVFVDMGFLKYFDQKGGRDVGDAALKVAADAMQRALERSGAKGEVYRYGGDEFTLLVDGGAEAAKSVIRAVAKIRHEAGRIPSGAFSKTEYAPTKLVFNYGYADRALVDGVWDDMIRAGAVSAETLANPGETANRKAELMTAAADAMLEGAKSVNRFMLLVNELRDASYEDPVRRAQVDSLVDYSKKSIFSERGGVALLRQWAASGESPISLLPEIERFVAEEIRAARDRDRETRSVRDELIEAHVKIRYLESELSRVRGTASAQGRKLGQLESRLRAAQDERQKIIDLRGRMSS